MKQKINFLLLLFLFAALCAAVSAQTLIEIKGAEGQTEFAFAADTPDPVIKQIPAEYGFILK